MTSEQTEHHNTDALDTAGALSTLSKEAGILLIMLLAGGTALYLGWDQISAIFEQQQKLSRAVEEVAEQESEINAHDIRIAELEKTPTKTHISQRTGPEAISARCQMTQSKTRALTT